MAIITTSLRSLNHCKLNLSLGQQYVTTLTLLLHWWFCMHECMAMYHCLTLRSRVFYYPNHNGNADFFCTCNLVLTHFYHISFCLSTYITSCEKLPIILLFVVASAASFYDSFKKQ